MSDELKHECGVAMVVLRKPPDNHSGDFGGTKLSLLMEKQHNRGQDGAGAAILAADPEPGAPPYWIAKSASSTPLADVLAAIGKRMVISHRGTETQRGAGTDKTLCASVPPCEKIFLGHLRYATYGKGDEAFCHPFVHEASELEHTLLLAGNFNLTNTAELFEAYRRQGEFPTSRSDGYLICEMIAQGLARNQEQASTCRNLLAGLRSALANADGAWTLCGMTGDGWAFATRDPHGIRPGWYYASEEVVAVASERPAIQAAFDVPPEAVRELPPGQALLVSPDGEVEMAEVRSANSQRPCAFERIYFSRANDAGIHRERKALGAALLPQILMSAQADLSDIFFSYIPNSARIAFHGLLEELFHRSVLTQRRSGSGGAEGDEEKLCGSAPSATLREFSIPRFGEIAVKDAKFRTFIADAAARSEFYKHVYDVTYGLVRPGRDTLVVLDDSIVRGNTMRNAILPMLDRLGPKRIVIASSAPPIRYPDCYGIDMSTLGELVAFRALVNLLGGRDALSHALARENASLPELYARFTDEEHCAEIARLLTPPGMKAEVKVVFQTVENMRRCLQPSTFQPFNSSTVSDGVGNDAIGDWYFTGDYPTPGGYKVLRKALQNYLDCKSERSY
jgi:amidophosphoribosyltransferase